MQNTPLQNRVGELFVSGFRGETPPAEILRQVEELSLGGVILFAENCTDHKRLCHSIESLQKHSDRQLLIAIDQEGGRVCRLQGKPAEFLSAEDYGSGAEQGPQALEAGLARYRSDFGSAAEYISELGINLLLGPVCDLRPDVEILKDSTALAERTFSAEPEIVSAFVKITVELAHKHNLICCLKHSPGLGSVRADPHIALGSSALSVSDFREREMSPFRAGCDAGAEMVMTSHFLIPALDSIPVTFSKSVIDLLIRDELSEEITLITDDLDMGALRKFRGAHDVCLAACNAGHDMLLARSNDTVVAGISALQKGLETGTLTEKRVIEALKRVDSLRNALERVA